MKPGKDPDSRHIPDCFFHYTGINNADRQAFSGFWFAISKGKRKCAAHFLDRVLVGLSWYEWGCFCVCVSLSLWHTILYVHCVYFNIRGAHLVWKPARGREPNKKFSFLPSYGHFYLRQDEVLQRQRASFVSISDWQKQIQLQSNCRQLLFKKKTVPSPPKTRGAILQSCKAHSVHFYSYSAKSQQAVISGSPQSLNDHQWGKGHLWIHVYLKK